MVTAVPIVHPKLFRGNVWYSGAGITSVRPEMTVTQWEQEVWKELADLFNGWQTSQAVLGAINATNQKMTIVPAEGTDANSFERADNEEDATEAGDPQRFQGGLAEGLPNDDKPVGTGFGSSASVFHTAKNYLGERGKPGGMPDEALLHEMVHGLRDMSGHERHLKVETFYGLFFEDLEEFFGILIANIYRSERGRFGLRADHIGHRPLEGALRNPDQFDRAYQKEMDNLYQTMKPLFMRIAKINKAAFNPIWSCVKRKLGITKREDIDFWYDYGLPGA